MKDKKLKDLDYATYLRIVGGAEECNDSDGLGWAVCKFLHWIDSADNGPNPWDDPNKGCCFTAETTVKTPTGERAIATFAAGDEVLAFDPQAGAVRPARVVAVDVHQAPSFPIIDLRDQDDAVQVTPGHRFHTRDGWMSIERLNGIECIDLSQKAHRTETRIGGANAQTVYNLRVEGLESYFVGRRGWLVRDN